MSARLKRATPHHSSKVDGPAWIAWTFFFGRDYGVKGGFAAA
jgi:hypothetical protein